MGLIFEQMCRDYLLYYADDLPFTLSDIGQWWGTDNASKKEVQIDIVSASSDSSEYIIEDNGSNSGSSAGDYVVDSGGSSNTSASGTVWIPRTGSKYHSTSTCSGMRNPSAVSLSEAIAWGYTACSKCW